MSTKQGYVDSSRFFQEAPMLDDNAYRDYLEKLGLSDPARTLLTDIRRSPPVRRVAGGRGNIHGRYPSCTVNPFVIQSL